MDEIFDLTPNEGLDPSALHAGDNISALTNNVGYLTQHQDISGKANITDLATVATSGSYNDLTNRPTIPTNVSDLTNDSGYLTSHQDITGKQDVISDLATIRSGAALGATALQPTAFVALTQTQYNALQNPDSNTYYMIIPEQQV